MNFLPDGPKSMWLIFTVKTDLKYGWVQCATWPPGAAYTDLLSAVVVLKKNKGTILTPAVLDVQVQNQSWQRHGDASAVTGTRRPGSKQEQERRLCFLRLPSPSPSD